MNSIMPNGYIVYRISDNRIVGALTRPKYPPLPEEGVAVMVASAALIDQAINHAPVSSWAIVGNWLAVTTEEALDYSPAQFEWCDAPNAPGCGDWRSEKRDYLAVWDFYKGEELTLSLFSGMDCEKTTALVARVTEILNATVDAAASAGASIKLTGRMRFVKYPWEHSIILQQEWVNSATGETEWLNVPTIAGVAHDA